MRHGMEWADEAGAPKVSDAVMVPSLSMHSVFVGDSFFDDNDEDPDEEDLVDLMDPEDLDEDGPSSVVLHFCSARCLAVWADQASAIEPSEEPSEG